MLRLIASGIFAISAYGQSAINPYDLARFIDSHTNIDWAPVWKAWGVTKPPAMPRCDPREYSSCSADVVTLLKPPQAILAVHALPGDTYLRFLDDGSGWRYAGSYVTSAKNHPGRYEFSRLGGRPFLRVSGQGPSGSDIDSEIETWFDLSLADFEPVFEFTVRGGEFRRGFGISREVQANVTSLDDHVGTIGLDVEIRYSSGYDADLGSAQFRATYERAASQKKFSLREATPSISNKDFEELVNIRGGPSNEKLLVYTLPRLKEIASGPDNENKDWLRSVLSHCKDTPEKRTLQALLDLKR